MPNKPQIRVERYVEARLAEEKEHVRRLIEHAIEKVKYEAWETRAWILLLTAASWGVLAQDQSPHRVIAAIVTLLLVLVAGGFMLGHRLLRKRELHLDDELDEDENV